MDTNRIFESVIASRIVQMEANLNKPKSKPFAIFQDLSTHWEGKSYSQSQSPSKKSNFLCLLVVTFSYRMHIY